MLFRHFSEHESEAKRLMAAELALPAFEQVRVKCSHTFNLLDARGAISVTERAAYIGRVRALAREVAQATTTRVSPRLPMRKTRGRQIMNKTLLVELPYRGAAAEGAGETSATFAAGFHAGLRERNLVQPVGEYKWFLPRRAVWRCRCLTVSPLRRMPKDAERSCRCPWR